VRGFGPDGNTCASRISVALNAAAAPINPVFVRIAAAATLGTSRGDLIIYRVADLRRYLVAAFGKPEVDSTSPFDDSFRRRKGIIAFSVNWKSATGHIALWDGSVYREWRTVSAVHDEQGRVAYHVSVFFEMDANKRMGGAVA
jgi:hypothetical protein